MTAVQCRIVSEDFTGQIIHTDYNGRTYFHAAGRCLD